MRTWYEWLSSSGLARVSEELLQVSLPSIRLSAQPAEERDLRLGSTKFGGSPDLPQETAWPEYNGSHLPFVAQINLSDIASYDRDHLFPATGIVSFFFDEEAFLESWSDEHAVPWHVCYSINPISSLQRLPMPASMPKRGRYHTGKVAYRTELTLPDYSQYDAFSLERLGLSSPLTDEEEQAYYQLQARLAGRVGTSSHIPIHRLLGHPDPVQWDMHQELGERAADWQLLFQVDSDDVPDTHWGDTGRIYYWIRTRDLAEKYFNQVQVILQSS